MVQWWNAATILGSVGLAVVHKGLLISYWHLYILQRLTLAAGYSDWEKHTDFLLSTHHSLLNHVMAATWECPCAITVKEAEDKYIHNMYIILKMYYKLHKKTLCISEIVQCQNLWPKMDIHQILKNVWLPPTTGPVSAELYIMTCCYIGCWEVADQAHFLTICPTFRHKRTQLYNHCATLDPNFYHSSLLLKIQLIIYNDLTVKLTLDRVYILFHNE